MALEESIFKHFLGGVELLRDPEGWDRAKVSIERDDVVKGLLFSYTSTLEFYDDGYAILKRAFDSDFTKPVEYKSLFRTGTGTYEPFFDGLIFLSDFDTCKFDHTRAFVSCQIEDKNFGARINNNKSIKAKLDVGLSKNEVKINAALFDEVDVFDVPTNNLSKENMIMWSVFEAFQYLISFMSDGKLFFESDYFLTGDGSSNYLTTGEILRTNPASLSEDTAPFISFEDLFENMHRLHNISFTIVRGNTVKIEPLNDLKEIQTQLQIKGVDVVKTGVDNSTLYAKIVCGDPNDEPFPLGSLPSVRFDTFAEEEFHLLTESNISESLEITLQDYIVSSNVIEDIIENGTDDNDDEIFLIDTIVTASELRTTNTNWLDLGDFYYNRSFTNRDTINRYFGSLPASIAQFLGDSTDGFLVTTPESAGGISEVISPVAGDTRTFIPYPTSIDTPLPLFNDGGNFDTTALEYNIPFNGIYSFSIVWDLIKTFGIGSVAYGGQTGSVGQVGSQEWQFRINRYDSGGIFIETIGSLDFHINSLTQQEQVIEISAVNTFLEQSDKIRAEITVFTTLGQRLTEYNISFKTILTNTGGGTFETFDIVDNRLIKNDFTHYLAFDQFAALNQNRNKIVEFLASNNYSGEGHIDRLDYDILTQGATFKLLGSGNRVS